MTRKIGNILIIEDEEPQKCEFCGVLKDTRPYSLDGKEICFDCAMETPERRLIAIRRYRQRLDDVDKVCICIK